MGHVEPVVAYATVFHKREGISHFQVTALWAGCGRVASRRFRPVPDGIGVALRVIRKRNRARVLHVPKMGQDIASLDGQVIERVSRSSRGGGRHIIEKLPM